MATRLQDATAEAKELARKIVLGAADAIDFAAEIGVELPFIGPIFKAINTIREKMEDVQSNREELVELHERCSGITARFVVECKTNSSGFDAAPLKCLVQEVDEFITRCQQKSRGVAILRPSEVKDEILTLNARIDRLTSDMGLAGVFDIAGTVNEIQAQSEAQAERETQILENTASILDRLPPLQVKLAKVPKGTPVCKTWHVERRQVTKTVLEALTVDGWPHLVGLVGDSGSGKTTAASEVVRSTGVREAFSDGIVWLTVNEGADERLSSLMLQLARMVYEDIAGSVGLRPASSDDGAAYIKRFVGKGHGGKGLKCLVVADNVWEEEVVSKLLETGMSVLVSTRHAELVVGAQGEAVGVDELSEEDAELLLRRAAKLPQGARLPDAAVDLVELCGRVAMDLAFVGRWSTVRGMEGRLAWSDAVRRVRTEMDKVRDGLVGATRGDSHDNRRKAILRAGFEELAVGSEDKRVPWLYLALAVMPDGHEFSVKDAAVLLYDREPSPDDEAPVRGVLDILERWTIIRSTEGVYRMHDAHSNFARTSLMDHGYVRRPAVKRWVKHISSLDALRSIAPYVLKGRWRAVELVGGDSWDKLRPYAKELAEMNTSDPSLRESLEAVADFQGVQEDWTEASNTWRRLLEVEKKELGADHPIVLGTYANLVHCADRLDDEDAATEWRRQENEVLPKALAKMRLQADAGDFEQEEYSRGVFALTAKRGRLGPDDRAAVEKLLRRCLAIFEAKLGPDDGEVAYTLRKLGRWVRDAGRLEEAEEYLTRCLAISEANLGVDDVWVAYTLNELGVCVREAGRFERAAELLRRSLEIKKAKLGPDDVQVAYTLHHLGITLRRAGQLGEAEEVLRRCLEIREDKLGPEDMKTARTLHKLGVCAREAGRLQEAEKLLRRCLSIKEAKLDPEDPDDLGLARTVHQLGVCLREAGWFEEAEGLFRRFLGIVESRLGPEGGKMPNTANNQLDDRQLGWLKKAHAILKGYLAIGEAKLGCKGKGVDEMLQDLPECLREARK